MDAIISKLVEQGPFAIMAAMLLYLFWSKDRDLTYSKDVHIKDVRETAEKVLADKLKETQVTENHSAMLERMLDLQEESSKALGDVARTLAAIERSQAELNVMLRMRQTVETPRTRKGTESS